MIETSRAILAPALLVVATALGASAAQEGAGAQRGLEAELQDAKQGAIEDLQKSAGRVVAERKSVVLERRRQTGGGEPESTGETDPERTRTPEQLQAAAESQKQAQNQMLTAAGRGLSEARLAGQTIGVSGQGGGWGRWYGGGVGWAATGGGGQMRGYRIGWAEDFSSQQQQHLARTKAQLGNAQATAGEMAGSKQDVRRSIQAEERRTAEQERAREAAKTPDERAREARVAAAQAFMEFEVLHRRRMAELDRLEALFRGRGRDDLVQRVETARLQQNAQYQEGLSAHRSELGDGVYEEILRRIDAAQQAESDS